MSKAKKVEHIDVSKVKHTTEVPKERKGKTEFERVKEAAEKQKP